MDDRGLLRLAAKAAEMTVNERAQADRDACGAGYIGLWIPEHSTCWNPLADDGDALRLAVKLNMCVTSFTDEKMAGYVVNGEGHNVSEEPGPDPYAATRRAIVRAAAEIERATAQKG